MLVMMVMMMVVVMTRAMADDDGNRGSVVLVEGLGPSLINFGKYGIPEGANDERDEESDFDYRNDVDYDPKAVPPEVRQAAESRTT